MAHDAAPAASMPQVLVPDAAFQLRHTSQPVMLLHMLTAICLPHPNQPYGAIICAGWLYIENVCAETIEPVNPSKYQAKSRPVRVAAAHRRDTFDFVPWLNLQALCLGACSIYKARRRDQLTQ